MSAFIEPPSHPTEPGPAEIHRRLPYGPRSVGHARVPAGREIGLRIARYDGRLRVEVADANNDRPQVREATAEDEHGRGLALVEALADRWGYCPRAHGIGKAVWAEVVIGR
ncbi:ATP-binding protein [Streptomyces sp. NPDC059477]|uniref:ATP-binding protein n=1 Tax=Streptomyces sp. NPDC059477 TaxID=3346847 RepID=UPI0036A7A335